MGLSAPPPGCPPVGLDVAIAYDVNWTTANCICLHYLLQKCKGVWVISWCLSSGRVDSTGVPWPWRPTSLLTAAVCTCAAHSFCFSYLKPQIRSGLSQHLFLLWSSTYRKQSPSKYCHTKKLNNFKLENQKKIIFQISIKNYSFFLCQNINF